MRAVEISRPGGPEVLVPAERPVPELRPGEVLIRVEAAGVSRPDALQRRGVYPPPPGASDIPGLEVAGVVEALQPASSPGAPGAETTPAAAPTFSVGDRVVALLAGGGYAEYCAAPIEQVLPLPAGLSAVEGASLPENFFTVWTNVFERGRLQAGETLLVHGGASGIGTTAIALGRALGARVLVTARGRERCEACVRAGADLAFDRETQDFVAETLAATEGRGADVILDMVVGDYLARDVEALAAEGRIVLIAFIKSPTAAFSVPALMQKRGTITGSTLRARKPAEKGRIARGLLSTVWPLLAAGKVRPIIDSTFPLADAARAHARLEQGAHVGKIVLEIAPSTRAR